ncbi:MAG: mandelate racemase/muconate lactonizing enzyme family protein [Planctomycetales bacterium]|nr:mandelate racemase/muconate lactonizing enzyme family protein [Planctomycetales bacterium]MCA9171495.1 mandelate racemase/muconate lactonizing enzyme family protein [Planctomycetales bacterium]
MRIDDVQLYYLAMPEIKDIGDGSQDALLVRVRADNLTGWGECEASPLVCLANWICPMSHSACKSVSHTVLGRRIDTPNDLVQLGDEVRAQGLDIAQTAHTWSGIEIALWDLLGKKLHEPTYRLLGYERAFPKTPYASQLFGQTPTETFAKAQQARRAGYRAVKFGWSVFGRGTVAADRDQLCAAREGLGADGILLVDAGTVWGENVAAAIERLPALRECSAHWLEEPFVGEASFAYAELSEHCHGLELAGGEGATSYHAARNLIDNGKIGFVQIDAGRIGGLAPAKRVADYASQRGVTYVNHTFTTHLALSASLAPYAGVEAAEICEYPVEPTDLARTLTRETLAVVDGQVSCPEQPGLGIEPDLDVVRRYLVDTEIRVGGKTLYRTPDL